MALTRSQVMARVRGKNTKPELRVRRLLTAMGYRYRLHRRDIPGRPDVAFIGRRKAIFVHGCFWHGHDCKRGSRAPKANVDYWREKIAANRRRDAAAGEALAALGWKALTLWECEMGDDEALTAKLRGFLDEGRSS
jgi:DNA mismatch endonuclease, patch repair protein